jgi:uncharacterized membrane protein
VHCHHPAWYIDGVNLQLSADVTASPSEVWAKTIDVERWPEFIESHQEIRRIDDGPIQLGSEAWVKQPGLPRAKWKVTVFEPEREFTWASKSGLVTTAGEHHIEPRPDGTGSTLRLAVRTTGPLTFLADALFGRRARRSLATELEGFRRALS